MRHLPETDHSSSSISHHPYHEAWWWQHHAMGMLFSGRDWKTCKDRGNNEWSKILEKNRIQSAKDVWLWRRLMFQQDNDPKHTVKATLQWLQNKNMKVLEWPCQNPDLNPIENLWKDLKIPVHRRSPSNFTELEQIYKEEWEKIPKSKCAQLIQTYSRRLEAVITAKSTSTKYWLKRLNTY